MSADRPNWSTVEDEPGSGHFELEVVTPTGITKNKVLAIEINPGEETEYFQTEFAKRYSRSCL